MRAVSYLEASLCGTAGKRVRLEDVLAGFGGKISLGVERGVLHEGEEFLRCGGSRAFLGGTGGFGGREGETR